MQIFIYGNDARLAECERLLCQAVERESKMASAYCDIHLLPIPSRAVRVEDIKNNLPKTGQRSNPTGQEQEPPCDIACKSGRTLGKEGTGAGDAEKSLVVGYEVPAFFYEMEGVEVFDLATDEPFLWRNARLCALGTLGVVLTGHTRVPSEMHIGLIGYGRIGKEVCDLFSYLEAPLVVFTSNSEVVPTLKEKGISVVLVNWKEKSAENVNQRLQNNGISMPIDIIINTSPTPMGEEFFDGFDGTVYDLASGKPIPECVKHTRLSSLPMRMYAQSAGVAVYRAIVEYLNKSNR